MGKILKESVKKICAYERHNTQHASESFKGSTSTLPIQPPKFPDINVQQIITNHINSTQL
jgi:hypothetical protein